MVRPLLFVFILIIPLLGNSQKKKAKFFVPLISLKMSISGDMSNSYQFSGPLGSSIKGEPEKSDGTCENHSTFNQVFYRSKKALQIWMVLKCNVSGKTFEFKPQRFFVDPKLPEQNVTLPAQSESFKKLQIQISEIQIKDTSNKK